MALRQLIVAGGRLGMEIMVSVCGNWSCGRVIDIEFPLSYKTENEFMQKSGFFMEIIFCRISFQSQCMAI
jgi:hypothetical protein